ncbi:MAG TPA: nucleotidyltransferase family protein [Dehalococcoidia bacterium]|nr:nucleotidyltransferase family protein [Dehalococcoidia bacterium]
MKRVAAILLAAGRSERMGRPKPLLPWGSQTLVAYQVTELAAAGCDPVIVVLGHDADAVLPHLDHPRVEVVVNPRYDEGRASSLRAGAQAVPYDADAVVVLSVDQPRPREVVLRLLAEHERSGALVTQPEHRGHRGHPVVLSAALLPELRQVTEETLGLRAVLRAHAGETRLVPFDDAVVTVDLNTPADVERAQPLFGLTNATGGEPEGPGRAAQ